MAETRREAQDRADWLLLFISGESLGVEEPDELDPIRIQKGMFLLSMRGPARDIYSFRPYNWGPFSPSIYADLEALEAQGLVTGRAVPGQTWLLYSATSGGRERADDFAGQLDDDQVKWLRTARSFVTSRSFDKLLRDIYSAYPEYSVNSLLR